MIQNRFYITLCRVTSNKETSCSLSIQTTTTRRTAIALVAMGACLAFLHFVDPPADTHFLRELLSTGHILVFGLIALLTLELQQSRDAKAYLRAFAVTLALGAASEFLQSFSPDRHSSLGDLARDASGAAVFLCLAALWGRESLGSISSVALAVVAVLSLSAGVAPLVLLSRDYAGRNAAFPKLCCFTGTWEQRFVETNSVELEPVAPPPGERGTGWARLRFSPAKWPGVTIEEVYPDWRDYEALSFEIYSDNPVSVALGLRVDDRAHDNRDYYDRFNRNLSIEPGLNSFQVPIAEILDAPSNRRMSVRHMRRILLFAVDPPRPFTLYWNGFRLVRAEPGTKSPSRG